MGLPENIDALLVKFDINQESLARVAGVAPATVTRWRQGSQMRRGSIEKICEFFGLSEDDLLSDSYGLAAKELGRGCANTRIYATSCGFVLVVDSGRATSSYRSVSA
jgi:repressor LexA